MVWVFGGILSLFGALTYAELSAMLPEAGGEYVYLNAAYGPFFGFVYGWTQTWVAKSASIAAMATVFATYLADFFPGLEPPWSRSAAHRSGLEAAGNPLGTIVCDRPDTVAGAGINYLGVRLGGDAQVALTGLKLALIGGLIAAGLLYAFRAHAAANLHSAMNAASGRGRRIFRGSGGGLVGLRRLE